MSKGHKSITLKLKVIKDPKVFALKLLKRKIKE